MSYLVEILRQLFQRVLYRFLIELFNVVVSDWIRLFKKFFSFDMKMYSNHYSYICIMANVPLDIEKKLKTVIHRIEEAAFLCGVGNESFDGSVSVRKLSIVAGMSERSLRDWFKVYTGQTVSHYISMRRAEYAKRIFRLFPDTSKSDVSRSIGLSNPQALYPFMRKNGITSIDGLRCSYYNTNETKSLGFRIDKLPDCVLFYTLNDTIYEKCSTHEFEKENWDKIEKFIKNRLSGTAIIGYVGFAIDRYIENKTDEGFFIAGILCKDDARTRTSCDIIGEIGRCSLHSHEYAVFTHTGDYANLSDIYLWCLETLRNNIIQIDKSHLLMERYLNSPVAASVGELKTEIWVPIIR